MHLAVIGTGYVGLVAGTGFADFGNDVWCVDIDADRIERLRRGEVPIYEPGLEPLLRRNVEQGRLRFTTDAAEAVAGAAVVFIAVGTPQGDYGGATNLDYVLSAARDVGRALTGPAVVVTKSTVPVGTAERVRETIAAETEHPFVVGSNPEFLKEGDAVNDFMKPARVIVGCEDDDAIATLRNLYAPFVRTTDRIQVMDVRSAELTKYAANAMLATRISFMNELALLAEKVGADIEKVRLGMGSDPRIGPKFLFPGPGFGGSCLVGAETVMVRRAGAIELVRLDELAGDPDEPSDATIDPEGLEVLAQQHPGAPPRFFPVESITRRAYEGELVSIRTKMGRRVRTTPDHPFVVVGADGEAARVALAAELDTESWLPVVLGGAGADAEQPAPFDLVEALPALGFSPEEVIVRLGRDCVRDPSVTEALRGVAGSSQRLWDARGSGAVRLHEARAAGVPVSGTLGTCRSGTYVPCEIPNTPAFWRIMGLYAAEGWVTADRGRNGAERLRISWTFHPTAEEDLVDEVVEFWRQLGIQARVYSPPTARKIVVSSRILARWLLEGLGAGSDCYDKRVPDALWRCSSEHKRAYLSGLWRGDGSWSFVQNRRGVVFEYGTVSPRLADGMLRLLGEQGIVASWKIGRPPGSTVDTHFLRVSGAAQVEQLLSFAPERDRDRIVESIESQTKRIAPTGWRAQQEAARVRVTGAERERFRGHVYSLEVPGAGTFVTTGGLVVHNCFPKDIRALTHTARGRGAELAVVEAADRANERQKRVLGARVQAHFGGATLTGKRVAVWGLAFKPETDDVRESPALTLIEDLLVAGATVAVYDPEAMDSARAVLAERVEYAGDMYDAAQGADALAVVTEWHAFRRPDFKRLREEMRGAALFDGRNVWNPAVVRELGFSYYGIGRL